MPTARRCSARRTLFAVVAMAMLSGSVGEARAAPAGWGRRGRGKVAPLSDSVERLRDAEAQVVKAERTAAKDVIFSEEELAKRLVEGQLKLGDADYEGAAIAFLDLVENHPDSQAGPQAVYFLGAALTHMDMERWAAELFAKNLADPRPEARRFHQKSVAQLFDLSVPRREAGFARRPGLSATPEVRARLQAVGIEVETAVPKGIIKAADADRLIRWAKSFPRESREAALSYAFGRYLFLTKRYDEAQAELDAISPLDIPISRGGPDAKWRVRAAYVAASASIGANEIEDALDRFERIVKAAPSNPRDRQIVELAWLAIARIHHDTGESDDAVRAYRRIGRDSVFFPEAMYETAWTLLRDGRYDQAIQALDLLLIYDPQSPIVPEIKQLRGKVHIQRRDYPMAEEEFLTLRRQFDRLGQNLQRKLSGQADSIEYFSAVVGEDMEHFSLGSLLPQEALPVARSLPRAVQAEDLARDVGSLQRELDETRELLARMEEAVAARDKARLFNDLGANVAGLDHVDDDLIAIREKLVFRLAARTRGAGVDQLESKRQALRGRLDEPLGTTGSKRRRIVAELQHMAEQAHKLELMVSQMRAQLVATEHYYEETRKDQKIDRQGFLIQAAEQRDSIAELDLEAGHLRDRITRAQAALRYHDPLQEAKSKAAAEYRDHLGRMYAALSGAASDPDAATVWRRVEDVQKRSDAARVALERTAAKRLESARRILEEERVNLDGYLAELTGKTTETKDLVGQVLAAAYRDVVGELANLTIRSEVGLLDVAWAMKETESEEIERLEVARDRDLREVDWAVDVGMEELGQ